VLEEFTAIPPSEAIRTGNALTWLAQTTTHQEKYFLASVDVFKYEGTLAELEGRTKNTPAAKEASREFSAGLKETREAQCLSALFCDRDGVVLIAYLARHRRDASVWTCSGVIAGAGSTASTSHSHLLSSSSRRLILLAHVPLPARRYMPPHARFPPPQRPARSTARLSAELVLGAPASAPRRFYGRTSLPAAPSPIPTSHPLNYAEQRLIKP
jgi:hypothetical protein